MPRDEERGTYCQHGEKIAEFPAGQPEKTQAIEPWPCRRLGCTREEFERALAAMEADLAEADKHAMGCNKSPDHQDPCDGDRGGLTY